MKSITYFGYWNLSNTFDITIVHGIKECILIPKELIMDVTFALANLRLCQIMCIIWQGKLLDMCILIILNALK